MFKKKILKFLPAICNPVCAKGGTRVAPNQCSCPSIVGGNNCLERIHVSFDIRYTSLFLANVVLSFCFKIKFASCI